jgi:hypothetical protein
MLKKLGLGLLCAAASISTNAYSMVTHTLQVGATVEYELPANQPQLFINYMFWPIEVNCQITTEDESNEIFAEGLARKGKINDVTIFEGESMTLIVQNGEILKLYAESGAKVKMTNLGLHTVKANCAASY